ncbi:MAG: GAF domain-containing protein [Gemmatimonadota bacterium]|nr:GAF domain-containing protein [Gemmatimonadota bacterium]
MFEIQDVATTSKPELYDGLAAQLRALLEGERDFIANAANFSSLLYHTLPDLNWAGFYLLREGELVLGPFQGKPACVRIAVGRGVCGRAAERRETVLVEDMNAFPGHIACDAGSRSEVVIPLLHDGRLLGVLDIDSPSPGRFDAEDAAGLERLLGIWLAASGAEVW